MEKENNKDTNKVETVDNTNSSDTLNTSDVEIEKKTSEDEIVDKKAEKANPAPIVYTNQLFKDLDDARLTFRKFYKLTEIFKWVVTVVVLAMIVTSFILFANMQNGITYMLVGTAIALVVLVAYTFIVGALKKKKMEQYFNVYYANINKYVFSDCYEDVKTTPNGKIELTDFTSSHLYSNIYAVPSRNMTTFKYKNTDFLLADCAAQVKDKKKLVPVFVGKMLNAPNTYQDDEPIYIYYTCKKELALPPTGLGGIAEVSKDDKMIIYSNNKNWKKTFKKPLKDALNALTVDNVLIDLSIAITKGKTFMTMGYDDCLMVIAFQNQFQPHPTEAFKSQLEKAVNIEVLLNETSKAEPKNDK